MRFRAKQTLGKYRIQMLLAEGGFAEVYRALDTIEGVPVALKIPHDHMVTDALLEDFRGEVRLTAQLDHPNVLSVKNAEFIEGHFAVVYPLGEGTLGERLQRRMSLAAKVDLAEQMLEAVAYAHANRVIHCDLKPENMILFPLGPKGARGFGAVRAAHAGRGGREAHPSGLRLRLTDFGLSKLSARTVHASGSGTVGYVSPEQAMGRTSFRADVFSLGLILWELFSGELPAWPFAWPPAGTQALRRRVHPDFIAFLRRAIRVNENLRYTDAGAMLASFRRLKRAGRILRDRSGSRRRPQSQRGQDWKELRLKQFERAYKQELSLTHRCGRCKGPLSEAMKACPWCGNQPARYRGETRHPERCPRCGRGRKRDWRYCPYCYGPGFRKVSERQYKDASYVDPRTGRCQAEGCDRRQLARFMRYCPWCRAKTARPWKITGARETCGRCGWSVLPDYWKACPWCAKKLEAR